MNLSPEVFTSEFVDFLCLHFDREPKSERIRNEYYKHFAKYSDEDFTKLCKLAFYECSSMPAPRWFDDRAYQLGASRREKRRTAALEQLLNSVKGGKRYE